MLQAVSCRPRSDASCARRDPPQICGRRTSITGCATALCTSLRRPEQLTSTGVGYFRACIHAAPCDGAFAPHLVAASADGAKRRVVAPLEPHGLCRPQGRQERAALRRTEARLAQGARAWPSARRHIWHCAPAIAHAHPAIAGQDWSKHPTAQLVCGSAGPARLRHDFAQSTRQEPCRPQCTYACLPCAPRDCVVPWLAAALQLRLRILATVDNIRALGLLRP